MKLKYNKIKFATLMQVVSVILLLGVNSCKKQNDFLNVKAKKGDVTPTTLMDFQAVLDNYNLNGQNSVSGLLGTDNVYVPAANLNTMSAGDRNTYLWAKDIYEGGPAFDWTYAYQRVEYANIVLDGLKAISPKSGSAFNNVLGSALFVRAFAFYQLSQLYCQPYIPSSAATDPGIPLRMTSDINVKSVRSTVAQTYQQILDDLKTAAALLPNDPILSTRPSIPAANALLAKVYLSMGDYRNAYAYADNALKSNGRLLDFNTLTINATNPFPPLKVGNPEVIYYTVSSGVAAITGRTCPGHIDPDLYSSYASGDLRLKAFFTADGSTGLYRMTNPYSVNAYLFTGLATDEIYLIRAESAARNGNLQAALGDLNFLLKNRHTPATFVPYSTSDPITLVKRIILERRKEMPFTANSRWEDLRRLNQDPLYAIILTRTYQGIAYTLSPNNKRYVLPLPADEINLEGLPQNDR